MSAPNKRSIEDRIAIVLSNFHDTKRKNTIPGDWAEFIRNLADHVIRRGSTKDKEYQTALATAEAEGTAPPPPAPFDPMFTLIAVMEQNLFRNQNKEVRKFGLGLLREALVVPAPPPAPRSNAPPPSVASRTIRLPKSPMTKIVTSLLQMFHDNDDAVRTAALDALKFYMQIDNEVVYSHMEDITIQTLMILPPFHDKRNGTVTDFLTSLAEILRNQMTCQRTDQAGEQKGETLPPVFDMSRFISLIVKGLNVAAERRSDAICAALVGKFLGLIDGSDDANILQDFHRIIGPLLELVKYRETANPVNTYLNQQQRAVEAWVQSHVLYEPLTRMNNNNNNNSAVTTPNQNDNNDDENNNTKHTNTTAKHSDPVPPAAAVTSSGTVGFNRVAALDAVVQCFESLNQGSCTAYSQALNTFLTWLVLLLTFRVPPGSGVEPQIPERCAAQVPRILTQILPLDPKTTQTLHERLEIVFRKWPHNVENSTKILECCLKTFLNSDRRGTTLLKWVGHVVAMSYDVASDRRDDINRALMECMNDAKEVHALAIHLLCRLAKNEKVLWERFVAGIVATMSDFKARIPTSFCMLQQFSAEVGFEPSFVLVASSKYIQKLNDKAFRAAMVKTFSLLICTAGEFDALRRILRDGTSANAEAKSTFESVFPCWCFNAAWSVGICLLTREFDLANALVEEIASGDVSAFVLEQLHRVVQLFESPTFAFARVALLRPKQNPALVRALFGVLMLLPQESSSFALLHRRLECVSQQQQALASLADGDDDGGAQQQKKNSQVSEKIEMFIKMQSELMAHEANINN